MFDKKKKEFDVTHEVTVHYKCKIKHNNDEYTVEGAEGNLTISCSRPFMYQSLLISREAFLAIADALKTEHKVVVK